MSPSLKDLADLLPKSQVESATRLGLCICPDLDRDSWSRLVASVVQFAGRTSGNRDTFTAWLGDLLAYGEDRYYGQITEYALAAALEPNTLRIAKLVCSRIPVLSRLNTLSWSHHCEIGKAFKELPEIERWLQIAEKKGLSKAELRKMIRKHLAEAAGNQESDSRSVANEPFALLRELRAVARFVSNHAGVWEGWSPAACRQALAEMEPVVSFIAKLEARSTGNRPAIARRAVQPIPRTA